MRVQVSLSRARERETEIISRDAQHDSWTIVHCLCEDQVGANRIVFFYVLVFTLLFKQFSLHGVRVANLASPRHTRFLLFCLSSTSLHSL